MGMKSFRLQEMEQYILEHDMVSMEELKDTFQISMNTARLDVAQLVNKGTVRKVYGGVCSNNKSNLVPFDERETRNIQGKRAVGKAAAALVNDGDIIYIDSGTTTMYMVDHLGERKNVTILTNNLNAINRALPYPDLNIISLPGALDRKTNSFVSADSVKTLEKYNIKKAFMASSGILESGTITNSSPLEFEIKKTAIVKSEEVYLMIDATKYGKSALLTYAHIEDMNGIIVDSGAEPGLKELCSQNNVKLYIADMAEEE